jgi:hypothetical protein
MHTNQPVYFFILSAMYFDINVIGYDSYINMYVYPCQHVSCIRITFVDILRPYSNIFFRMSLSVLRTHIESRSFNPFVKIFTSLNIIIFFLGIS